MPIRLSRQFTIVNSLDPNSSSGGAVWLSPQPAFGDIDIDNDGVMSTPYQFLIDLSVATSQLEGRQASMMAGYKIHSVTMGIRPVDDVWDNDESAFFAGRIGWLPVTDHAKKMLKLARQVEKATEDSQIDGDSFLLSTETDYSGMRFGWSGDNQVWEQTAENISGFGGNQWDLASLRSVYNQQTAVPQSNALFTGRAPDVNTAQFVCALASGIGTGDSPPPGGMAADHTISVQTEALCGLLWGQFQFSSGDEVGDINDDYDVVVTVNWTPEVSKW